MKLRIFVVDDEESIRDTIKWHLEAQGHEVITATEPLMCDIYHGCECNELYPCGDVLFVDYWMPGMTGLDFLDLMHKRGCKGNPANKFIMSGNTALIDIEKVEEIGCSVIQKPILLDEIDSIIKKVMSRLPEDRQLSNIKTLMTKSVN